MTPASAQVALGEVLYLREERVEVTPGCEYPQVGVYGFGRGLFKRENVCFGETTYKYFNRLYEGALVVSQVKGWEGAIAVVSKDFAGSFASPEYRTFWCDESRVDPAYLLYVLLSSGFSQSILTATRGQGARRERVRPERLLMQQVRLPPLAEQRRIVAKIERLAAKIDDARGLSRKRDIEVEKLPASYAHHLFSEELVAIADAVPLGEIADVQSGVTLGRQLQEPTIELPYLRVANVQDGFLDLSMIKAIAVYEYEKERWLLKRGDILLTEGGDWDKLGRGAVWCEEIPDCIHQNHIFRVRIDQHAFDPRYIVALTGSPYGKAYFQDASKQTTNLASINQRQLKAFPVYRLPIQEQRRIVAYLDGLQAKINRLKALQAQTRAELNALLPSILDRAFKGER